MEKGGVKIWTDVDNLTMPPSVAPAQIAPGRSPGLWSTNEQIAFPYLHNCEIQWHYDLNETTYRCGGSVGITL